jgi:hypothetical protein
LHRFASPTHFFLFEAQKFLLNFRIVSLEPKTNGAPKSGYLSCALFLRDSIPFSKPEGIAILVGDKMTSTTKKNFLGFKYERNTALRLSLNKNIKIVRTTQNLKFLGAPYP